MTTTRTGQAGRRNSIHHGYLQTRGEGPQTFVRGVCQCKCLGKSDGQGHPAVCHKRSRPPTRTAQHPRGVLEPDRRQEGQNNRRRKEEEGMKDSPAHPELSLSGPRTSKRPHPHLDSSCLIEVVKEILQPRRCASISKYEQSSYRGC